MSSVAAGRWSMVHVMAPALLAIASTATTAIHVRKVFFIIEISSLLLTAKKTRLSSFLRAIPSPPIFLVFQNLISRLELTGSSCTSVVCGHLGRSERPCQEEIPKNMLPDHEDRVNSFRTHGLALVQPDRPAALVVGTVRGHRLGENDVEPAVPVEVGELDPLPERVQDRLFVLGHLREGPVRLLEEDPQLVLLGIGEDDVIQAVAVEIPHGQCVLRGLSRLLAPHAVAAPGPALVAVDGDADRPRL